LIDLIEVLNDGHYKLELFSDWPAYHDKFEANKLRTRMADDKVKNSSTPFIRCGFCQENVYVKARFDVVEERISYFLSHYINNDSNLKEPCPQRSKNQAQHLDFLRAMKYRGQQEGKEHYRLKHLIAKTLAYDQSVPAESILIEKTIRHQGEWRRPDVQAIVNGKVTAFEVQLATEFVMMIHHRQYFYQQFGQIIWVMPELDPDELNQSQLDIAHSNGHHLFVLDAAHENLSATTKVFHLLCWVNEPSLEDNKITRRWTSRSVTLSDISFVNGSAQVVDTDALEATLKKQIIKLKPTQRQPVNTFSKERSPEISAQENADNFLIDYRSFLFKVFHLSPDYVRKILSSLSVSSTDEKDLATTYLRLNGIFINEHSCSEFIQTVFRSINNGGLVQKHAAHNWLWILQHIHKHHKVWFGLVVHLLKRKGLWAGILNTYKAKLTPLIKESQSHQVKPTQDQYRIACFLVPILEQRGDIWDTARIISNIQSLSYCAEVALDGSLYVPDLHHNCEKHQYAAQYSMNERLEYLCFEAIRRIPLPNIPIGQPGRILCIDVGSRCLLKLIKSYRQTIDSLDHYVTGY